MGLVDGVAHALHAGEAAALEVVGIARLADPALDGDGQVHDRRAGGVAHVECRAVHRQRLDGRAHGHVVLVGAIQLLALHRLVAAAHDGDQLARVPVHHRRGALGLHHRQILAAAQGGLGGAVVGVAHGRVLAPVGDGFLYGLLHLGVQAGEHLVAAVAQLGLHLAAVVAGVLQALDPKHLRHHIVDGILDVVGVVVHVVAGGGAAFDDVQRVGPGRLVLLLGDEAMVQHLLQHVVGALVGLLRGVAGVVVPAGIVAPGVADQARQAGALPQGQVIQVLAEVVLGGDLHAVAGTAHVDHVQVGLQDLLLGQVLLQLQGQVGLLHLALVVLVAVQKGQLHQLAGDGGRALSGAAQQVVHQRAADALQVHAVMLVEAGVLDGDDGVDELLGNVLDLHVDAVFGPLELHDQVALAVVDEGGLALGPDGRQVQIWRGVYPALGDARRQAHARQRDQQHHEEQHLHRGHDHGEQEVPVRLPRFEYRVFQSSWPPKRIIVQYINLHYTTGFNNVHVFLMSIW